jgi:peptide/nickel transport system permease protein
MLALVMLYLANVFFGTTIGGLMGPEFIGKPWSWAKLVSILEHSWIPVFIIGLGGTAGMIRKMRANLLDELQKQYVVTARAKGLPRQVLQYHRARLNFFISDISAACCPIIPAPGSPRCAVAATTRGQSLKL